MSAMSIRWIISARPGQACKGMLLDVAGAYREMKVARVESLEELETNCVAVEEG